MELAVLHLHTSIYCIHLEPVFYSSNVTFFRQRNLPFQSTFKLEIMRDVISHTGNSINYTVLCKVVTNLNNHINFSEILKVTSLFYLLLSKLKQAK
jgi:hypothetical protein